MKRWLSKIRWRSVFGNLAVLFTVYFVIHTYQTWDSPKGKMPQLSGVTLDGERVSLPQDLQGSTLVHFWATWCSICRLEQSSINSLSESFPVIAIASQSGSAGEVAKVVSQREITAPVVVDESGVLASRFGVKAFPSSFVVDEEGDIRFVEVGYTTQFGLSLRLLFADWF